MKKQEYTQEMEVQVGWMGKQRRRDCAMPFPTTEQLEKELNRERYRKSYGQVLLSTIYMLITVAAAAVLIAVLLLPVLQIYGTSMSPTLTERISCFL